MVAYNTEFIEPVNEAQNIIDKVYRLWSARPESITIDNQYRIAIKGWIVPPVKDTAKRMHEYVSTYPNIIPNSQKPNTFRFEFGSPYETELLSPNNAAPFMAEGVPDSKKIQTLLRGVANFSRPAAERLAPVFDVGNSTFNCSALWAILGIMERQAKVCEDAAIVLNVTNVEEHISYVDVFPDDPENVSAVTTAINAAARDNLICFRYNELMPSELNVLRILSAGLSKLAVPADSAIMPIASIFSSPPLQMVIWDDCPIPARGALWVPTSQEIKFAADNIAQTMDKKDEAVQGFVLAQTLLTGVTFEEPVLAHAGHKVLRYITCGLETDTHLLPRPKGVNVLWQMLNMVKRTVNDLPLFETEYDRLSALTVHRRMCVGTVVASLYGLGISAAFHSVNLTGRDMTVWATIRNASINPAGSFINDMVQCYKRADGEVSQVPITFLNIMAVNFIPSITTMVLNYKCLLGSTFCGGFGKLVNVGSTTA